MDARQLAAQPDLDFTPREPVRWLAPAQLARTALKVGLSGAFAAYLDKRETQASFGAELIDVPADADGGLWLDYAADTGDGFDATATVAWLLAQPTLPGTQNDDQATDLPRGSVLVLGGDEVYPTPTVGDYDDRLKGPLRSALPDPHASSVIDVRTRAEAAAGQNRPTLLAIPGNHDWYDGLTAFVRTFTQGRRIGGWQTVQQRSYFAARLPQRWWLVGLDTQLGAELDDPQVRFFREQLTPQLQPGDGVVVCAPTPTWVRVGQGRDRAFDQLRWFEKQIVEPAGAQVRLWLSGDDHLYAHYVETGPGGSDGSDGTDGEPLPAPRHAVTCGLGGAYLATTADLPDTLAVPGPGSRMPEEPTRYVRTAEWPDVATSRSLHRGCVTSPTRTIPLRNPGFWTLVGGLHVLAFVVLSVVLAFSLRRSPAAAVRDADLHHVGHLAMQSVFWCAWLLGVGAVTTLLRRAGFVWVGPALAAIAQLALALGSLAGICALPWPGGTPPWLVYLAALVATGAVTGYVASLLIGVTLLVFGRFGGQSTLGSGAREAVMSSQAIEDWKGLLRIRLRPDGVLVVHALGVRHVCRQWDVVSPAAGAGAAKRVVPAKGHEPRPTPIDEPFEVRRG